MGRGKCGTFGEMAVKGGSEYFYFAFGVGFEGFGGANRWQNQGAGGGAAR